MSSTFSGFEISKRGLHTHQRALEVTGHNVSNADNKNYARQRVEQTTMDPIYEPSLNRAETAGQIGQGVKIAAIRRIRDSFYDDQIIQSSASQSYWGVRKTYLSQIQSTLGEPGGNTLRTLVDKFWQGWQNLSQFPAEIGHRQVLLENGQQLTDRLRDTFAKINTLRLQADREVHFLVDEVNSIGTELRDLNEKILKLVALGDNPNDLLDRRDAMLEKLGQIVNVRVGRSDRDELIVFIGEQALVQGEVQRFLQAQSDATNNGLTNVVWQHNQRQLILNQDSQLSSLLEVRDRDLVQSLNDIDTIAVNLADVVNEIHRDGFGLSQKTDQNFFHLKDRNGQSIHSDIIANDVADIDLDFDGIADHTAVFRMSGLTQLLPNQLDSPLGLAGTITLQRSDVNSTEVTIDYQVSDSLLDIIERINNENIGVTAYMNHANQFAFKATTSSARDRNFMIRYVADSGDLLVGRLGLLQASGAAGAFDYTTTGALAQLNVDSESIVLTPQQNPGATIAISGDVRGDVANIAASYGRDRNADGNPELANRSGDGTLALAISRALKEENKMFGPEKTFADFYGSMIGDLAGRGRSAIDEVERYADSMVFLQNQRQGIMGVNLDEEMSNLVQFQHSYNASARMLRAFNEMYDVIINGIGA